MTLENTCMVTTQQFEINAQVRTETGRGANRRLRRDGKVTGIMYGAGKDPLPLMVPFNELVKQLEHESFYSRVITVRIDGQPERVVLKDLQRHPSTSFPLHIDLQRVSETEKLHMHVPLHFVNEAICPGVKQGGGLIERQMVEIEIRCLPKDLPEFIEVDVGELQLGQVIHLSDLKLPAGVELFVAGGQDAEHDIPIVSVHLPRGVIEVEGAATAEAVPAGTTPAAPPTETK
jgi:large subunit ribosomal protein L25